MAPRIPLRLLRGGDAGGIFSRNSYDRDAPQYDSVPSELELPLESTDTDSDGGGGGGSVPDALDHEVLREEEEREKLLSGGKGIFGPIGVKIGKKVKGARGRRSAKSAGDVASMMGGKRLGMEDGSGEYGIMDPDGGESEFGSYEDSEDDDDYLMEKKVLEKKPRKPSVRKVFVFSFLLVIFFLTLIISSLKLSRDRLDGKLTPPPPKLVYSNGTHPYHKTTILISLDGLRADFLDRKLTPTLEAFANSGVTTDYMTPAFPSVTFPNHWTLVTGLYPESHGIVSNMFWDPVSKREFFYTDSEKSLKQDWWGGEPIWMTAELQGLRAAVHMWPGSEAPGWGATVVDKFNMTESLNRKVDRILGWLDLPASLRPQLIASYVPDIDVSGHKYGPNTTETDNAIKAVDSMLHDLFLGLESRNLTEIVNLVIVSDHGMATTSKDKLVYLEDIVDTKLIEHIDGLPLYGLRPYDDQNLTAIYNSIKEKEPGDGSWKVYLRDVDMPKRWHFSNNPRIAPLWLVPETGWTIITKEDRSPDSKDEYSPRGLHGFDNEHPLMRAIFVARGPAFRHLHGEGREYLGLDRHTGAPTNDSSKTKGEVRGSRVKPFENIELYRLLCQSLGINETVHGTNATLDELEIVVDGSGGSSSYFSATPLPTNTTASPDEDVPSHPTKITDASVSNTDITSAPPAESVPPRPTKIAATNAAIQTPTDTSTAPPDYVAPKRPTKAAASPESSPTSSKAQDIAVRPPAPPPDQQKPESDGSEEKDPGKMSWWELLESKAEKMKGELEGWWSKVWKDKKNG